MGRGPRGREGIVIGPANLLFDVLFAVEGDLFVEVLTEKTEIVEPENMIGMIVREDSSVRQVNVLTDQLKSQFRWRVNQKGALRSLDGDAAPRALVSRIVGNTDLAMAADHRDANAGSGSQEHQVPWIRHGH